MPYKAFKEGDEFVVYKLNDNDEKIGKPLGKHPSMAKANEQVKALYAAENKEQGEDKEADNLEKCDDMMEPVILTGGSTSLKDLLAAEAAHEAAEEVRDLTGKFHYIVDNIMASDEEDKEGMLVSAANEFAELASQKTKNPEEKELSLVDKIKSLIGLDKKEEQETEEKELFIWKEDGQYRWIAAYSNNRRDKEAEIISSDSHKRFDEGLQKGLYPMPELWLWHLPYRVGVTKWHAYDEQKGFPVAAGVFDRGKEWAAEAILESKEWTGVSHGMPKVHIKRDDKDKSIIIQHVTREISILPAGAAANKFSFHLITKESDMTDKSLPAHKLEGLVNLAGEERAKEVEAALANKAKEADEEGIEKKEETQEQPEQQEHEQEPKEVSRDELKAVLGELASTIKSLDTRLKAIEKSEETKEEEFDLVAFLKEKSVIGSDEAKVDGRSTLAKDAPEETKSTTPTQENVGFQIGIVDRLFDANQQWAQGGKQ